MSSIANLNEGLYVGKRLVKFSFTFCSDWKFLALMMGTGAANSDYFCPWCLASKDTKVFLDTDCEKYERKWQGKSHCYLCKDKKDKVCYKNKHGWEKENLLKPPFDRLNCKIDVLHAGLRTSEVMEHVLFEDAATYGLDLKLQKLALQVG